MASFAVIGLGRFGSYLATRLYELGHEVLGVDADTDVVQGLADRLSQALVVDARDKAQLRAVGLKDMDTVVIALGDHLEASTLAALYCKELEVRVLARAANVDHGKILEALGVDDVVYPERDIALRTAEQLSNTNLLDFIALGPEYAIVEVAVAEPFIGKSLTELNVRSRHNVNVIAIRDVLTEHVTLPSPSTVLRESDVLVVLGRTEDIEKFKKLG